MLVVRSLAAMAFFAFVAAQTPVLAQDADSDAKKAIAIQAKCAGAKEASPLRRLRVEKIKVEDKTVNVTGVFLRSGLGKIDAEDVALNNELTPICEAVLGQKELSLKLEKLTFIAPKDLPHLDLQKLANTEGRDEVLLEPFAFDETGKAILNARVGTTADKRWLMDAAKKLSTESTKKLATSWPPQDKVQVVEVWKLGRGPLQKVLAADVGNLSRVRVERVRYEWAIVADEAGDQLTRRVAISGLYLESPLKKEAFSSIVEKLWPELPWDTAPKLTVDPSGAIGEGVEVPESELVKALRTAIADQPSLDGVRIDPKMSFDGEGRLLLAGIIPQQENKFATELASAVSKIAEEAGKVPGREGGLTYARATGGGVSTAKMQLIQTAKLLREVQDWAALEVDDVLLRRLYFNADGKLTLLGRFAEPGTDKQVLKKYQTTAETYLQKSDPVVDLKPFEAGLTVHLRSQVENDQKTWAGVLLERGYFSPEGAYGIRGLADRGDQPEILSKIIKAESKNPRWAGYFDAAPNVVDMKVMPLAPMLARMQRVCPGYPAFDHLELIGVVQHPKDGLVLSVNAYTSSSTELAALTADWLLKRHPDWKRRAKPGVKFKTTVESETSDESRWLSPFLAAEALAKEKMPQARLNLASATRHFPDSSATWYLSALYHSSLAGDQELVRRDLYRVIQIEGQLLPSRDVYRNDARSSRFDLAEKVHGPERASVEVLEPWLRREMRDGRQQIQLVAEPDVVLAK